MFTYAQHVLNGAATLTNVTFPEMLTDADKILHDSQKLCVKYPAAMIPPSQLPYFKLEDIQTYYKKRNAMNTPEKQADMLVRRSMQQQLKLLHEAKYQTCADDSDTDDFIDEKNRIQEEMILLEQTVSAYNSRIIDVPHDSNSMFHAIRYYLIRNNFLNEEISVEKMREIAVATIRENHKKIVDGATPISDAEEITLAYSPILDPIPSPSLPRISSGLYLPEFLSTPPPRATAAPTSSHDVSGITSPSTTTSTVQSTSGTEVVSAHVPVSSPTPISSHIVCTARRKVME